MVSITSYQIYRFYKHSDKKMEIDLIFNRLHFWVNSGNISIFTNPKSRKDTHGWGLRVRGCRGRELWPLHSLDKL